MPINYITLDKGRQMGNDLLQVIDTLRLYQDKLRQHKEMMDNLTDGINYTAIENQYGVPTGKGDEVYNLVAGSVSELSADTNINQLLDWIIPAV
jgi:hypothetical protein